MTPISQARDGGTFVLLRTTALIPLASSAENDMTNPA
jgi:hypothetical protein